MSDLRQIQIVDVKQYPNKTQAHGAGTIWYKLSEIPEKDWEEDFKSAYDHLMGDDSNRQHAQNIPQGHQDLINQSGHIYTKGDDGPHIVIPVNGISLDAIKDWLTRFIEECVNKANLRGILKRDCQKEIARKWPGGKQDIRGVTYNTEDPDTRLIGYRGVGARYLTEQKSPHPASRLYYNKRDAKYFIHKHTTDGEIKPIDAATARHSMDHDGFDQCINEDEKEKIKQSDGLNKRR